MSELTENESAQEPPVVEPASPVAQPVPLEKAENQVNTAAEVKPTPSPVKSKTNKVDCLLKNAGDAPIMKKKRWTVDETKTIAYIIEFIRKYIKCEPSESLFVYVNQIFAPSPDESLKNLYECFGTDGKLILHYCKSQAWG